MNAVSHGAPAGAVRRARAAGWVLAPLVLLGAAGCRDDPGARPPLTGGPGASVEQELDQMESTLDNIESELNEG